jgi:hypothetical protein
MLLAVAPASAAVRNAAPGAAGAEPCNPAPCSLASAVKGAKAGDQVVLTPGVYKLATKLLVNKAIEIGGLPGAPASIELSGPEGVKVESSGAVLHDLRLTLTEETMDYVLDMKAGTVERIYAAEGEGGPCRMSQGTLRDSLCIGGLYVSPGAAGNYVASISNVTATPILVGAFETAKLTATITNTIALPDPAAGGSKSGLLVDVAAGSSASVTLANSNYASVDTTLSSGKDFTYTPPGTNGNQTAPPEFANPAGGDFSQLPTSPTIDAGSAAGPIRSFDVLGSPRSQARCIGGTPIPDIGAYELTPTVPCPGGAAEEVPVAILAQVAPPAPGRMGFGRLKLDTGKGIATLAVTASGAGRLALSGKGIVARSAKCKSGETVKLKIAAKGQKATKLRNVGKAQVQAAVTFTPADGGQPATKTRRLTLKLTQ